MALSEVDIQILPSLGSTGKDDPETASNPMTNGSKKNGSDEDDIQIIAECNSIRKINGIHSDVSKIDINTAVQASKHCAEDLDVLTSGETYTEARKCFSIGDENILDKRTSPVSSNREQTSVKANDQMVEEIRTSEMSSKSCKRSSNVFSNDEVGHPKKRCKNEDTNDGSIDCADPGLEVTALKPADVIGNESKSTEKQEQVSDNEKCTDSVKIEIKTGSTFVEVSQSKTSSQLLLQSDSMTTSGNDSAESAIDVKRGAQEKEPVTLNGNNLKIEETEVKRGGDLESLKPCQNSSSSEQKLANESASSRKVISENSTDLTSKLTENVKNLEKSNVKEDRAEKALNVSSNSTDDSIPLSFAGIFAKNASEAAQEIEKVCDGTPLKSEKTGECELINDTEKSDSIKSFREQEKKTDTSVQALPLKDLIGKLENRISTDLPSGPEVIEEDLKDGDSKSNTSSSKSALSTQSVTSNRSNEKKFVITFEKLEKIIRGEIMKEREKMERDMRTLHNNAELWKHQARKLQIQVKDLMSSPTYNQKRKSHLTQTRNMSVQVSTEKINTVQQKYVAASVPNHFTLNKTSQAIVSQPQVMYALPINTQGNIPRLAGQTNNSTNLQVIRNVNGTMRSILNNPSNSQSQSFTLPPGSRVVAPPGVQIRHVTPQAVATPRQKPKQSEKSVIDLTDDDDIVITATTRRDSANSSQNKNVTSVAKKLIHPAPLPSKPVPRKEPNTNQDPPPRPSLKISRVQQGIVLSWNMTIEANTATVTNYQLFAYQEGSAVPSSSLWKKVGDVKALPLPMACTLTQFQEGNKYHFAVRAMDKFGRIGDFSRPSSVHLALPVS